MSSFNCPKCNMPQVDTSLGYATGCDHYRPDIPAVNYTYSQLQRTKKLLKELWTLDGFVPDQLADEIEKVLNNE